MPGSRCCPARRVTPELIPRMRACRGAGASLGAYQTDQFRNTDMIEGYRRLGEEAAEAGARNDRRPVRLRRHGELLPRCRSSTSERYPAMARIAVEPGESAVLSGGTPGTHRIEAVGSASARAPLAGGDRRRDRGADAADAFAMARLATRREGLFSGPSTGANIVAALPRPAGSARGTGF